MRFGVVIPGGDATEIVDLGVAAEAAGWDGVFLWEGLYHLDPWGLLSAIAARTERIRLGTMLTPLPWRRPWKLAAQLVTLDRLSGGRAGLSVGLGAYEPEHFGRVGEPTARAERAGRLTEGLSILRGLWSTADGRFTFAGQHYDVDIVAGPQPTHGSIPVWIVGATGSSASMGRITAADGWIPTTKGDDGMRQSTPDEIAAQLSTMGERPADVIVEGVTPGDDPVGQAAVLRPWIDAGATWWIEVDWANAGAVAERIAAGPPRQT